VQVMQEGQTIKHEAVRTGQSSRPRIRNARRLISTTTDPSFFVTSIFVAELIGEAPATPPKTKRRPQKHLQPPKATKKAAAARSRPSKHCIPVLQHPVRSARNGRRGVSECR